MELWTLIFSGVAAIAAAAATWIGWLVYRQQTTADLPAVSIHIVPHDIANWYEVNVTVANRSDVEWKADKMAALKPSGAKLVSSFDVPRGNDGYGNETAPDLGAVRLGGLSNQAKARLSVMPMGRGSGPSMILGSTDRHSEAFFVFVPSKASRALSIRYSLYSMEAAQRRKAIVMKRTLMAHPAAETA